MQKLWSERIPYIKTMKEFYSKMEYKELNLWPIMANEVYTYYKNQEQRTKKERLFTILRCLFLKEKINVDNQHKGKILATYFMPRKDHEELVKKAIKKFSDKELFFLNQSKIRINSFFQRYIPVIPNLFLLLNLFNIFKKNKLKKVLGKNYLLFLAKTYLRYKQINQIKKIYSLSKPKAHISFCSSAFPEEAILTLLCNKDNIPTFTLQHGFLDNHSNTFFTFIIQSENFISRYMLLWGKSSYNFQKQYASKERLILVGNPKYENFSQKKFYYDEKNNYTFFASVIPNISNNQEAIKILNSFAEEHPEIRINIKIHPFDSFENYKKLVTSKNISFVDLNSSIPELLAKSSLIIVHNTSIAYEGLLYNVPILRYKDTNFANLWKNNDTFSNLEEFRKLIEKLKNTNYLKKQLKFYESERDKHFYFEKNKSPSEVYYNKINQLIKRKN